MKPRFTPEEHAEVGQVLAAIRDELVRRHVQVANAYPRTSPAPRALVKALNALEEARSALDSALFQEHPEVAQPSVYYPSQEDRGSVVIPAKRRP